MSTISRKPSSKAVFSSGSGHRRRGRVKLCHSAKPCGKDHEDATVWSVEARYAEKYAASVINQVHNVMTNCISCGTVQSVATVDNFLGGGGITIGNNKQFMCLGYELVYHVYQKLKTLFRLKNRMFLWHTLNRRHTM